MTKKHHLYTLVFDGEPEPVVFYVGHTNDPKRRANEHRAAARDPANTEYKYQWIRQLEAVGATWDFVEIGLIDNDEDSEYEWVLKFARHNRSKDITFIDDLPLTNMKAGDFLGEILDDPAISTREEIKQYRQQRAAEKKISYERDQANFKPEHQAAVDLVQADWQQAHVEELVKKQSKINRELKSIEQLASPERAERIKQETLLLLERELIEGGISWTEYNQQVLASGGYPKWTEMPDKKVVIDRFKSK